MDAGFNGAEGGYQTAGATGCWYGFVDMRQVHGRDGRNNRMLTQATHKRQAGLYMLVPMVLSKRVF